MIESFLGETCSILHLTENSRDSFGQYDYWKQDDVPCMFSSVFETVKRIPGSINLVRDFDLLISTNINTKIKATDRIVYDDYEYDIVSGGIFISKDLITTEEEVIMVSVQKRQIYPQNKVEIKRS